MIPLAHAEIPERVITYKLVEYYQDSATTSEAVGYYFGISVYCPALAPDGLTIQLRSPTGQTVPLTFNKRTIVYEMTSARFATKADLEAVFPDGTYTVLVSGEQSPSSTTFTYATKSDISPVLISNFDELQRTNTLRPTLTWPSIPGATATDFLWAAVAGSDGAPLSESPDTASPLITEWRSDPLIANAPLFGELEYIATTVTHTNNNETLLATGTGSLVICPFSITLPPPVITANPVSVQTYAGGFADLGVLATSEGLQYQWYHDGVAIAGATDGGFHLSNVKPSDAGSYTVDVSNASGRVTSQPATVVLAPTMMWGYLSGSGFPDGTTAVDGPPTSARFAGPSGLAVDSAGNIYVADAKSAAVRKVLPDGTVTTIAGALSQPGSADGVGAAARFTLPTGIVMDGAGYLFVSDCGTHTIRRIAPDGMVTTIAGASGEAGAADGYGAAARFNQPWGLALDAAGNLFVADSGNHVIREITPMGFVATIAGKAGVAGYADGVAAAARFSSPHGLAFDHAGNLLVVDHDNNVIRRIDPSGAVSTLGNPTAGPAFPGPAMEASYPAGDSIVVDPTGTLYCTTSAGVCRITPDGFATVVDQSGSQLGLAVDLTGNVYSAHPNTIVEGTLAPGTPGPLITVTRAPVSGAIASGGWVTFSVNATGYVQRYQWLRNGVPIKGANGPTLLLQGITEPATYTVELANACGYVTATAPVQIVDPSAASRIVNLSIRSRTAGGGDTLIAGFGINGGAEGAKLPLLLRGVGPTLADFGVADALNDPWIQLYGGPVVLASNARWGGGSPLATTFAAVGAFGLPANSADSALLTSLPGGSYTMLLQATDGGSGTGLAEIYDTSTDGAGAPHLINVSARGRVGDGADVLVAGFVIRGPTNKSVLIRGIGPSLTRFGVTGTIQDPTLAVYSGDQKIGENDNYAYDEQVLAAERQVAAFNMDYFESALVLTLAPGAYTAQVSAKSDSGVGLVEVYELP